MLSVWIAFTAEVDRCATADVMSWKLPCVQAPFSERPARRSLSVDYVTLYRSRAYRVRMRYHGSCSLSMYKAFWTP